MHKDVSYFYFCKSDSLNACKVLYCCICGDAVAHNILLFLYIPSSTIIPFCSTHRE